MTGEAIAYIYPDRCTALYGSFVNGELITAHLASVTFSKSGRPHFEIVPNCKNKFYIQEVLHIRFFGASPDALSFWGFLAVKRMLSEMKKPFRCFQQSSLVDTWMLNKRYDIVYCIVLCKQLFCSSSDIFNFWRKKC